MRWDRAFVDFRKVKGHTVLLEKIKLEHIQKCHYRSILCSAAASFSITIKLYSSFVDMDEAKLRVGIGIFLASALSSVLLFIVAKAQR